MAVGKNVGSILDSKLLDGVKDVGVGTVFGLGMDVYFGAGQYKESREQGTSRLGSAARAVGEGVVSNMLGFKYMGLKLAAGAPKAIVSGAMKLDQNSRSMSRGTRNTPFQNAKFNDTQQAYTMRQTGMQLAEASKHNLQSAMLGNEAQYLHL